MRVLIEFKDKRVDIKHPISRKQTYEDTVDELDSLINQALDVVENDS